MRVAVIGGAGQMGSWFVRYFAGRGFSTTVSDLRDLEAKAVAESTGAELSRTNLDAVQGADLTLVCVPITGTERAIREVAPHMKGGSVLAEISSLKGPTMRSMRKIADTGVVPLSLHPLFGPAVEGIEGKTMVVVPVADGEKEMRLAEELFDEAEIVVSEVEEHDRAMALVLSLTYFMNLAFARVLDEEDITLLKKLAGTTFTVQLTIAESIVSESPDLVESLLKENEFTETYLGRFLEHAEEIRGLVGGERHGLVDLHSSLVASMKRDPDYKDAAERRNKAFRAL